jgi:hypothetical protein
MRYLEEVGDGAGLGVWSGDVVRDQVIRSALTVILVAQVRAAVA